ncbi:hypothetical protein E1A91_D04G050400v1 [Gossypium mustelinum]|uniref:Uncharacterized protein n=1 Tax=Gossypium mustelinum TaxID=34275 RepID=A0A5D2VAC1_GOSMU|nr:hypothetical protein E1A91_D04G050400v1 [Gossypium mustelinum]
MRQVKGSVKEAYGINSSKVSTLSLLFVMKLLFFNFLNELL